MYSTELGSCVKAMGAGGRWRPYKNQTLEVSHPGNGAAPVSALVRYWWLETLRASDMPTHYLCHTGPVRGWSQDIGQSEASIDQSEVSCHSHEALQSVTNSRGSDLRLLISPGALK